ncbi:MAG: nucleotidyltransferase family protein [Vicinamibacterales bacterium]
MTPPTPLSIARALAGVASSRHELMEVRDILSRGDADAVRLWHLLKHGGVLPLLASAIGSSLAEEPRNARLADALRSAYEVNTLRNAVLRKTAVDASRALVAGGITPLWVKGSWLAFEVYAQPGLRVMSDIDLFVPQGRRAAAVSILQAIGFERTPDVQDGAAAWTDTLKRAASLPGGGDAVEIDLHDTVRMSQSRVWPVAVLWDRSREMRIGGVPVRVPSREAGLLYIAVHLFKHGLDLRHTLMAVCDTATLLRRHAEPLDLTWIEQQCGDLPTAVALYVLLTLVGDLPTPDARTLHAQLRTKLDTHGLRKPADNLVSRADTLSLIRSSDFSLFDVGEQVATPAAALRFLVDGVRRWRRRTGGGEEAAALPRLLSRTNWRYAVATFQAGRLHARAGRHAT